MAAEALIPVNAPCPPLDCAHLQHPPHTLPCTVYRTQQNKGLKRKISDGGGGSEAGGGGGGGGAGSSGSSGNWMRRFHELAYLADKASLDGAKVGSYVCMGETLGGKGGNGWVCC
jgi:hypothetical protein